MQGNHHEIEVSLAVKYTVYDALKRVMSGLLGV